MTRFPKIATAVTLAAAGTIALAADPIKIGVDGPFTGGSSSMGVSMRDGVRLAIDEINKSGGVLGRQLVAVERDDEAKNERGVQIAQELVNKEKVVATVGYINTGVARDGARLDDRDGRVHTASADATDPESVAAVAGGHEVAISAVTNHQAP